MRLTLEQMTVSNFKGLHHLEVNFAAERTEIKGANATGKTSIVDAFCWVLWNQNANGDAPGSDNFREKPLDEDGNTLHNLDTTVELRCLLDGQRFDLKRTQTENWVKKRGNAEATFQGNVSTYWINGVETKKQEFDQRIKALADSEVTRLVGSLGAFNALEWKKRRAQLMALAGDDVDGELLARDEYRPLADEIAERNIKADDLRKVLADQKKAVSNELKMLPVRIDEAKKSIPDLKPSEIKDAEYMVRDMRESIKTVEGQINDLKAQAGGASNRGQALALEQEIITIKRRIADEYEAQKRRLVTEAEDASANLLKVSGLLGEAKRDLDVDTENRNRWEEIRNELRGKYTERKRKPIEVNEVCPTCGQTLPPTAVEATRAKAEAEKKEALLEIQREGKKAAEKVDMYAGFVVQEQERIKFLEERVESATKARTAVQKAIKGYPTEPDYGADTRFIEATAQLDALKAERSIAPDEKVRQLEIRKEELIGIVNRNMQILAKRDVGIEAEERIKSYEGRQRELGAQLAETETKMMLLERFVQDRCGALEASINSHFPTVRWKLFDTQINGGITDACMAMLDCDGVYVPYESANTASQIAADVEIVDVLSKAYDIRIPLFIDNGERILNIPQIDSQTITLSVSTDAKLNVH